MKKRIIWMLAAILICGISSVQAQVMKVADLEKYAKERYGDKWLDAAKNLSKDLTLDKNESLSYQQIIEVPDKNSQQIYIALNYWATATFKDKQAITLNDKEAGCIIVSSTIHNIVEHMGTINKYSVSITPVIKIDIKDGRVRVTYTVQSYDILADISGGWLSPVDKDHKSYGDSKRKADDKTKQFGEGDPQLTVTITDNNDATGHTIGAEVSRQIRRELRDYRVISRPDARTENGEAVGHHEIIVKAPTTGQAPNVTELKPRNYTITFVNGDLNITKALMIVKANDQYVDYGKEPNPYDVTITTSTRTLKWQKAGKDGLSAEKEAINAQIKDLVELSVLPGKNMMGGNENAYKLTVKESGSYALAKEGDFGNQTIEGDPFEVINAGTYVEGFCNGWLTVYPLTRIPLGKEALAEVLGIDLEKNPTAEVNLQKVLKDHKGLEGIEVILPARKMEADQWYEWVLPFDVTPRDFFYPYYDDEEELVEPIWGYGAIDVLDVAKSKSGKVVFSAQVANTIKANTPFIVKVDETIAAKDMEKISFTMQGDRVIADFDYVNNDPESVSNDKSVKFVGLYYDKTGIASNQLYLAKASGHTDREFWPGGETAKDLTLVRTKAYLEFPTAEAAQRAIILVEDENGTTTEITGVEADAEVAYGEGWYTITGVKLDAEPVTTGTYIFNGKKVFIQK